MKRRGKKRYQSFAPNCLKVVVRDGRIFCVGGLSKHTQSDEVSLESRVRYPARWLHGTTGIRKAYRERHQGGGLSHMGGEQS